MKTRLFGRIYTTLVFVFLYAPIVLLIAFSFSSSKYTFKFGSFTLDWYAELFADGRLLMLLGNTILLAVISSVIATVIGTLAAVGICRMKKRMQRFILTVTNIPMTNPDIVTGVSLALLFVFLGTVLKNDNILSFWTLLIAHITFSLPYVILSVLPKMRQLDNSLVDAALDLGCTPRQAFFKVAFPQIMPGVFSGMAMAFTMSLDDFVISYFVSGTSFVTLPVEIYSYTKKLISPSVYSLFTLMFFIILVIMILMNISDIKNANRVQKGRQAK